MIFDYDKYLVAFLKISMSYKGLSEFTETFFLLSRGHNVCKGLRQLHELIRRRDNSTLPPVS